MKTLHSILIILCTTCTGFSQGWLSQGARSSALANSGVALIDIYSYHHNPGALGYLKEGLVGLSYEAKYALKELQQQSIALAVPLKVGVISAGGQFYGYDSYRTTRAGVGYSIKLAENISAGVQINYLGMSLGNTYYGRKNTVSAELGILARLNNKISLGVSASNITRTKLSSYQDDRYGTILRLGAAYYILDNLMLTGEVEQEISKPTRLRLGIEYAPIPLLFIRAGVQGAPLDFAFGFGLVFGRVKIDLSSQYNQRLGWSPVVSLVVNFYKPKSSPKE
ncbi:MAG: hypothetical protein M9897_10335 [Brumimicrobium sp.]|nr:hypothetical protein [Brumimicrobium sp.]